MAHVLRRRIRRSVEINVEMEQLLIPAGSSTELLTTTCPRCGRAAVCLNLDQAAAAAGLSAQRLRECLRSGSLHVDPSTDGRLWVCVASLVEYCTHDVRKDRTP